jgi:hypothetical protein
VPAIRAPITSTHSGNGTSSGWQQQRLRALQRVRVPQPLLSVPADESRTAAAQIGGMLRELPFNTIGDIARHGLELHVYCSRCFATRRLDLEANMAWHCRAIAPPRFRCRRCGTPGVPKIRPAKLLQVGGPVTLAFLWCNTCVWEIDQAQLDKPPWSGSSQRYRCPGCRRAVDWHIHGPAWRPGGNGKGLDDVGRL